MTRLDEACKDIGSSAFGMTACNQYLIDCQSKVTIIAKYWL